MAARLQPASASSPAISCARSMAPPSTAPRLWKQLPPRTRAGGALRSNAAGRYCARSCGTDGFMADLFNADEPEKAPSGRPLADRLRPKNLDEVVGQEHLTG